jgi:hypothetical protein
MIIPQIIVCKIRHAHIENVNFQPVTLIRYPINGAKKKEPTPVPVIVMPVANPIFLSKYSVTTISEAK